MKKKKKESIRVKINFMSNFRLDMRFLLILHFDPICFNFVHPQQLFQSLNQAQKATIKKKFKDENKKISFYSELPTHLVYLVIYKQGCKFYLNSMNTNLNILKQVKNLIYSLDLSKTCKDKVRFWIRYINYFT